VCQEHIIVARFLRSRSSSAAIKATSYYPGWSYQFGDAGTNAFQERELDNRHFYWSEGSHLSFDAAKMILSDLTAFPNLRYGKTLDNKSTPFILDDWKAQLGEWAAVNPKYIKDVFTAVPNARDFLQDGKVTPRTDAR
jgi:hypothetical protein